MGTTKDGTEISIKEMSDEHLNNVINAIERIEQMENQFYDVIDFI